MQFNTFFSLFYFNSLSLSKKQTLCEISLSLTLQLNLRFPTYQLLYFSALVF